MPGSTTSFLTNPFAPTATRCNARSATAGSATPKWSGSFLLALDVADALPKVARRVTLYASSEDKALQVSKTLHQFARAGGAGVELIVCKGINTIDAQHSSAPCPPAPRCYIHLDIRTSRSYETATTPFP